MPATATRPRIDYPRPPVTVLHTDLFREPVYENGEPYAVTDEEYEEPVIITA
ncbi:hypothetical protein [Streptomyces olivaceoviridis]|uniref:hypothetical protein n=1 Tax=Streptomyces olivaceoviridis TaxID=1921 RepID=UPI0036A3E1B3